MPDVKCQCGNVMDVPSFLEGQHVFCNKCGARLMAGGASGSGPAEQGYGAPPPQPPQQPWGAPQGAPGGYPPPPPPPGYGQPYQQPYGGYQEPPFSGKATAGIILAFCCPLLGLIFSILALIDCNNKGYRGKGLAIAGIIVSGINMVVGVAIQLAGFTFGG